ncbi:M20/M25/M40 family metallo-hydrolase [Candidatus Bathyarchaeota archaeon]|nr:M20/M25/M40 family metallo-hydrolase [Candidatus Bathyarchaeota archaeon]
MKYSGWKNLKDSPIKFLHKIVEIYSPSGNEEVLAHFLVEEMKKLGFEVNIDLVGNVIGIIGNGSKKILLCGHIDTVNPFLPVKYAEGILYGRGSVDAKGPFAAFVFAASELAKEGVDAQFIVAGVVDEEGKSRGIKHLIEKGIQADYAIFGEPTSVDTITIGYKGCLTQKIICETETGHSSAPWLYINSIEKGLELWGLIDEVSKNNTVTFSHFESITTCLKKISGGQDNNIVPSKCELLIDTRLPPNIKCSEYKFMIEKILDNFRKMNPNVKVTYEIEDETEAYVTQKKSSIVKAFIQSIWKIRKKQVKLTYKTGTGDMNVFGSSTEIPCITYGPGDSIFDHTMNEQIHASDLEAGIQIIKEALIKLSISDNV